MNIKNLSTPSLLFLTISITTNLLSLFIAPYHCNLTPYSCGIILICSILLTIILIYFITWFIDKIYFTGRPIFSWILSIFFIYFNLFEFYSLLKNKNTQQVINNRSDTNVFTEKEKTIHL